jgi:hypothetical protein
MKDKTRTSKLKSLQLQWRVYLSQPHPQLHFPHHAKSSINEAFLNW